MPYFNFNGIPHEVWFDRRGYAHITATIDGRETPIKLHKVVYIATHGVPPEGYDIHHIDCNKRNYHPDNLIAVSRKEHCRIHAMKRECEEDDWF